jgi:hypothetical protein
MLTSGAASGGVLVRGPLGGGPQDLGEDTPGLRHAPLADLPGVGVQAEIRLVLLEQYKLFGHVLIVPQGCDD